MKMGKFKEMQEKALDYFEKGNIVLTEKERKNIEVADFGLNDVERTGLQLVVYINTDRVCAKEMVLLPNQTCPEHRHPNIKNQLGKEETFRCRSGMVYLYVDGISSEKRSTNPPKGDEKYYSVFHEVVLNPGEQYTIYPNTLHWFKAGDEGAVVSEFSTKSKDEADVFTDMRIKRIPEIES